MKPQYIKIDEAGDKFYYSDKEMELLHREDGPAFEGANGYKSWWINDNQFTEAEFNARKNNKPSCAGKVVEIDGKKYKLIPD